jgi:regulator of protease activity HflC (stomatin/prohibitin superfamily)
MKMSKGSIGGVIAALVIFVGVLGGILCLERVPTGYVGVVYSMNGGVQDEVLTQGWHIVSPTKKVKEFTVGNEQLVLSKDARDGSEGDDSFAVATADNANIDISFQMSYRYDIDRVVDTYKNFKGMSGADIVNTRVRTVLKAKISEITTDRTMMDLYSGNRNEVNALLTEFLNRELGEQFGIEVIDASIIDVHPDAQLQKTIADRVTALQKKQQAEAEQETIAVQNETKLMQARAEAEAKQIAAEAEAKANKVIADSITEPLLKKMEMEARQAHGWIEVQGGTVVTTAK